MQQLKLKPYSPTIGCEIDGVNLAEPLSDASRDAVYQALLDWKVIFFRDQNISTEQHLAFARNFGELEVHPFAPEKPGFPQVLAITHDETRPGGENLWHSDVTWRQEPSLGSILRCIECPPTGGDTLFSDMCAAYDGLPVWLKEQVEGREALHNFEGFRNRLANRGATEQELQAYDVRFPNPKHPVIRTHPDTGKQAIYVNGGFTKHIVGMDADESQQILSMLYAQAATPEYQCRFRWEPNSIAFWDNRACQHYAASDYWPARRVVERVTVVGNKPFYQPSAVSTCNDDSVVESQHRASRYQGRLKRFARSDGMHAVPNGYR